MKLSAKIIEDIIRNRENEIHFEESDSCYTGTVRIYRDQSMKMCIGLNDHHYTKDGKKSFLHLDVRMYDANTSSNPIMQKILPCTSKTLVRLSKAINKSLRDQKKLEEYKLKKAAQQQLDLLQGKPAAIEKPKQPYYG